MEVFTSQVSRLGGRCSLMLSNRWVSRKLQTNSDGDATQECRLRNCSVSRHQHSGDTVGVVGILAVYQLAAISLSACQLESLMLSKFLIFHSVLKGSFLIPGIILFCDPDTQMSPLHAHTRSRALWRYLGASSWRAASPKKSVHTHSTGWVAKWNGISARFFHVYIVENQVPVNHAAVLCPRVRDAGRQLFSPPCLGTTSN